MHHIALEMNAAAKSINLAPGTKPWHVLQSEENCFSVSHCLKRYRSGQDNFLLFTLLYWAGDNSPASVNAHTFI